MEEIREVLLSRINQDDRSFCASFSRDPARLERSLARAGQITPLLLRDRPGVCGFQIVHGFRRVEALARLGLKTARAVILPEADAPDPRAFDLMFWDNLTTRGFNLVEAALALRTLVVEVGMDHCQVLELYLPALGFEPSEKVLGRLLRVLDLEDHWLAWIATQELSLRSACLVLKVPEGDRPALFEIITSLRPGQNLLRELIPLLAEIAAREGGRITELIRCPELKLLSDPDRADRNRRLEEVMNHLRARRHPEQGRLNSATKELVASLSLPPGVDMSRPSRLDPLTLCFKVEADSATGLQARARALLEAARHPALARFFSQWDDDRNHHHQPGGKAAPACPRDRGPLCGGPGNLRRRAAPNARQGQIRA